MRPISMRPRRHIVLPALLGAALALSGCRAAPTTAAQAPEPVRVTIGRGDVAQTITATGTVSAHTSADLSFEVSGRIVQVSVDEGDVVSAGDAIAAIDDSDLADAVASAELALVSAQLQLEQTQKPPTAAELAAARASLAQAEAALAALYEGPSEADRRDAQLNLDRAKNSLWSAQAQRDGTKGSPMASDSAVDGAEASVLNAEVAVQQAELAMQRLDEAPKASAVASAEAQVAAARSTLARLNDQPDALAIESARNGVAQAELNLQQAQQRLEKATLRAPFGGVIVSSTLQAGGYAVANQPVAQLAQLEPLQVTARIDELDVADLRTGQRAIVTFDALGATPHAGELTFVSPQAVVSGGIPTYEARITLAASDASLRLGMSADIEVVIAEAQGVLLVPNQALEVDREAGKQYVTLVSATGATRREVQLGIQGADMAEVRDGLREGDTVQLVTVAAANTDVLPTMPMGGGMRP